MTNVDQVRRLLFLLDHCNMPDLTQEFGWRREHNGCAIELHVTDGRMRAVCYYIPETQMFDLLLALFES